MIITRNDTINKFHTNPTALRDEARLLPPDDCAKVFRILKAYLWGPQASVALVAPMVNLIWDLLDTEAQKVIKQLGRKPGDEDLFQRLSLIQGTQAALEDADWDE